MATAKKAAPKKAVAKKAAPSAPKAAAPAKPRKTEFVAILREYPQAPRKVRLVTDLVKGKKVVDALAELSFLPKRASLPIKKLIDSALASAVASGRKPEHLKVKNITVDQGEVLVRFMPRAQGRATPIRRKRSLVKVTLA